MSPESNAETPEKSVVIHATTVAMAGRAALFRGPSGSGKSGLALQLIALGAVLVSDDRTQLSRWDADLLVFAPVAFANRIEARFVGLLKAPVASSAKLAFIVDMEHEELDRLPVQRHENWLGVDVPVIRKSSAPHFPASVALYLQGERLD